MLKSLQGKLLLVFMFALIFNLFRRNMAVSASPNNKGKDQTVRKEKMGETINDSRRSTREGWRKVKNESCEMVNGKTKCFVKKAKHTAESGADRLEDLVD